MADDFEKVFAASRFSQHLRIVDHIHSDPHRGALYEAVSTESVFTESRKTCITKRCRDYAIRVYDIRYAAETYGLDPYMLRQSQGLSLHHPNLMKFYDIDLVFHTECKNVVTPECSSASMLILMELASGNLSHWLNIRRHKASMADVHRLGFDVLNGLAYLHHCGFVHRRLHPFNIMMVEVEGAGDSDHMVAKIGDFQDMASYSHTALPIRDEHSAYTAPEILMGYDIYSPSADMWSLGVVLFEMLMGVGRTPFVDAQHDSRWFKTSQRKYVLSRIFQWLGTPSREWREKYTLSCDVSTDAYEGTDFISGLSTFFPEFKITRREAPILDLIVKCLQLDPEKRITAAAALHHPAFQECIECRAKLGIKNSAIEKGTMQPSIPRGTWSDIRTDIIRNLERDISGGLVQYYPALMSIYIFDRCPSILDNREPGFIYSVFCACYLLGVKLMVDLPVPTPDIFNDAKGIVCGASEDNRVNILFLERVIVNGLAFRFDVLEISSVPVTPSIFTTLLGQPFRPHKLDTRKKMESLPAMPQFTSEPRRSLTKVHRHKHK